jgi:hypothetical protein
MVDPGSYTYQPSQRLDQAAKRRERFYDRLLKSSHRKRQAVESLRPCIQLLAASTAVPKTGPFNLAVRS